MKYTLTFDNGVVYTSPDIRSKDPGWASENGEKNVGIRELTFKITGAGASLVLKGFEAYNFFVEASQAIGCAGAKIDAFCFCGRYRGHVVLYRIDFKTKQITKRLSADGKEYFGSATRGWRKGLMWENARSGLCPLQ
jgi:hypothetical protein